MKGDYYDNILERRLVCQSILEIENYQKKNTLKS